MATSLEKKTTTFKKRGKSNVKALPFQETPARNHVKRLKLQNLSKCQSYQDDNIGKINKNSTKNFEIWWVDLLSLDLRTKSLVETRGEQKIKILF